MLVTTSSEVQSYIMSFNVRLLYPLYFSVLIHNSCGCSQRVVCTCVLALQLG